VPPKDSVIGSRRLSYLVVPIALGLVAAALPGRAQEPQDPRFAFADTTLLRDTLGLHFPRLFPLADSLEMLPDTLRALSIRYRWNPERLVQLADSLGVPVDSVGPLMDRERLNPLGASGISSNDFSYNTSYSVGQRQSTWRNTADFRSNRGPAFVSNATTIELSRPDRRSRRQNRSSNTEIGWKLSPDLSVGGRVNLLRYDSRDASIYSVADRTNEYQLSIRSRHRPVRSVTSEANVFAGLVSKASTGGRPDIPGTLPTSETNGASGELSARVRHTAGRWLQQEVSEQFSTSRTRTSATSGTGLNLGDYSNSVRGTASLFQAAPVSLKASFSMSRFHRENPDSDSLLITNGSSSNVSGTLRIRQDTNRYLDLTRETATNEQRTVERRPYSGGPEFPQSAAAGQAQRTAASLNYLLRGWSLQGRFSLRHQNKTTRTRSIDGTLLRRLSQRIDLKGTANMELTSTGRFERGVSDIDSDRGVRGYRLEAAYNSGNKLTTATAFGLSREERVYVPSNVSNTTTDTRRYLAEWRWSYRLLPGFTATQRNEISANYVTKRFLADKGTVFLNYSSFTTLNAILTPRLTINVNHEVRKQPSGDYSQFPDGIYYYSPADETQTYRIAVPVTYTPSPALSLNISPTYISTRRMGTVDGIAVPQSTNQSMNLTGGTNLNWPVTSRGRLTGDLQRSYRVDRSIAYPAGLPRISPRAEFFFWSGSLQFSWQL
jgi:hypothetical protein